MRSHRGLLALAALASLAWAALLALPGQAGEKKNPAATPSPRMGKGGQPDAKWMQRHEGFVAIAKKGDVDVLFLGDSITDGWRFKNGKATWDRHFGPLKAANFGIGGDRTEHVLWRISNGEMDHIKPKVAVLMIGTNNTGANSAEQIAAGITAIVKKINELSPETKVLLLAVFPRGEKAEGNKARVKIIEINKQISKLEGKRVRYLDIGGKFLQDDGTLTRDIMPDFLHLSGRGYEIWAEAILPRLREMLGKPE
ncbi:MAG: GDSL-type esterase/lipase family protein [Gemmataceae bacterium]|nr:GDSL-type esterase/lipase family protein [Gemmataceae bacterium]